MAFDAFFKFYDQPIHCEQCDELAVGMRVLSLAPVLSLHVREHGGRSMHLRCCLRLLRGCHVSCEGFRAEPGPQLRVQYLFVFAGRGSLRERWGKTMMRALRLLYGDWPGFSSISPAGDSLDGMGMRAAAKPLPEVVPASALGKRGFQSVSSASGSPIRRLRRRIDGSSNSTVSIHFVHDKPQIPTRRAKRPRLSPPNSDVSIPAAVAAAAAAPVPSPAVRASALAAADDCASACACAFTAPFLAGSLGNETCGEV